MTECPGILLVEDDEDDYILARDLLRDIYEGPLRLDWAQTWSDGLDGIVKGVHDVYLIDYRLGDRTGVELVRQVVDQGCTAPIILLTGQDDRYIDLEAMKAGATDYLVKGEISAALLDRAIRYAIKRHESEAALRQSEARAASAEQRLVDAIDSLSEGLVLWDADCHGSLLPLGRPGAGKLLHKSSHAISDGTNLRHGFLHHLNLDGDCGRRYHFPPEGLQRHARRNPAVFGITHGKGGSGWGPKHTGLVRRRGFVLRGDRELGY